MSTFLCINHISVIYDNHVCAFLYGTHINGIILRAYEPRHEKTCFFAYEKTKPQISCAVTAQLISAFVFATQVAQPIDFLNLKFQASRHLLWPYISVCVGHVQKSWISCCSSYYFTYVYWPLFLYRIERLWKWCLVTSFLECADTRWTLILLAS